MNCYNFSFRKSYTGFWKINGSGKKIPGTLYLHEHSIEIDLFSDGQDMSSKINYLNGEAYAKDEDNKDVFYKFHIGGLHFKNGTHFTQGLNQTLFDVEYFLIYPQIRNLMTKSKKSIRS